MRNFILILCLLLIIIYSKAATPDPGVTGPMAVSSEEYSLGNLAFNPPSFNFNVEVRGIVHYPTNLSSGPFPVLIFLHGRHSACYNPTFNTTNPNNWPCSNGDLEIPNYKGYNYLAQHFASHGYIVISISANAISVDDNSHGDSGMKARAELIQHHLDLWNTYNTLGGAPFTNPNKFIGKLDLNNVGTMGHSRGGEGVVQHAIYNQQQGSPYGIRAVLAVAPVDFNRPVLHDIPVGVILPYCDGDVGDLQGVHFYDDARYVDPQDITAKHSFLFMGANHNYFNTIWTPGGFPAGTIDDWRTIGSGSPQNESFCGENSGSNQRFSPAKQRAALLAYSSAFFRKYIGGEDQFSPIIETDDITPPASSTLANNDVYVSYHAPGNQRIDINRTDTESSENTNTLGSQVITNSLAAYDICGDDASEEYCLNVGTFQQPHNKSSSNSSKLGLAQLGIRWDNNTDYYENQIPSAFQNLSQYKSLQFRASVNFTNSPNNQALNFSVQLRDKNGATHSEKIQTNSGVLFFPPGSWNNVLPRILHNTIKIPIQNYSTIDLTDVVAIRFLFDASVNGSIFISDLSLSSDSAITLSPLAYFNTDVTTTCDGKITFEDASLFTPSQWFWDFGDGTSSSNQHPIHTYTASGSYTVKLKVSNYLGADSLEKKALINVNRPSAPSTNGDSICDSGVVNLSAIPSNSGNLIWYDDLNSINSINTGNTYSPNINSTTTYYVEEVVGGTTVFGGKVDNTGGGGNYDGARWLFFDVFEKCILKSVKVYAQGTADRIIQLVDNKDNVIASKTINIPNGEQRINLNFNLSSGSDYSLRIIGSANLFRSNNTGINYPYNIGGLLSITKSNVTAPDQLKYYYFFYDWEVQSPDCISKRAAVTGIISSCNDSCPSDPNKTSPGQCGCGTPDIDTDNDGTADCNDACPNDPNKTNPGICGCGVVDIDIDNDGTADCNDACPNDSNKTSPEQCGCGVADIDSDNDGTADCNDACPNDPNTISLPCTTVEVGEIGTSTGVRIYPNPTSDNLTIEFPEQNSKHYTIIIMNVVGEIVKEQKSTSSKIVNMENLNSGLYFLQLIGDDISNAVYKVVKR